MKYLFFIIAICILFTNVYADDFKVIGNSGISADKISKETLKNIYLGKKSSLDDGTKVIPVILEQNGVYKSFIKDIVKKSVNQFKTFWKKAIFTGRGNPPKSFSNVEDLIDYVKENENTIAFVSNEQEVSGVKTLTIE